MSQIFMLWYSIHGLQNMDRWDKEHTGDIEKIKNKQGYCQEVLEEGGHNRDVRLCPLTNESINAIANGVAAVATIVGILINRDAVQ